MSFTADSRLDQDQEMFEHNSQAYAQAKGMQHAPTMALQEQLALAPSLRVTSP